MKIETQTCLNMMQIMESQEVFEIQSLQIVNQQQPKII